MPQQPTESGSWKFRWPVLYDAGGPEIPSFKYASRIDGAIINMQVVLDKWYGQNGENIEKINKVINRVIL